MNNASAFEIVIVSRKPSTLATVAAIVNAPYVWVGTRDGSVIVSAGARVDIETARAKLDAAGVSYRA